MLLLASQYNCSHACASVCTAGTLLQNGGDSYTSWRKIEVGGVEAGLLTTVVEPSWHVALEFNGGRAGVGSDDAAK